jgi:hypothetical protein
MILYSSGGENRSLGLGTFVVLFCFGRLVVIPCLASSFFCFQQLLFLVTKHILSLYSLNLFIAKVTIV